MSLKSLYFNILPRRSRQAGACVVIGVLALALLARASSREDGPPPVPALPPSLAALYPPVAERPVHLLAMLELQDGFSGIVVDLLEGDVAQARASYVEFAQRYRRAADLVPEWRAAYPEEPVRSLGSALAGGDRPATMAAIDAVGAVCHACHQVAMASVQLRYRWGRFADVTVADPLTGGAASYAAFKRGLATNLAGITHDLRQGEVENARRQFDGFRARFAALSESCNTCHDTPRRSFVDLSVQAVVDALGRALAAAVPDLAAVVRLTAGIGQASCSACHLVHTPAAQAQAAIRASEEVGR